jgi:hypothetical protein
VQRILDAITDSPADVRNGRRDILAANRLGYALYSELYLDPTRPANVARFVFLSPRAGAFFPDREGAANDIVANLRIEAGRNPCDRGLHGGGRGDCDGSGQTLEGSGSVAAPSR